MHPHALLTTLVLVALATLTLGAGCTADPTAAPADRADAALMAPEALASFVPPAPPGWQPLAPPSAVTLEEDGAALASVTASYVSADGARTADLALQDTGGRPVGLRRLADDLASAGANGTAPPPVVLGGRPARTVEAGGVAGACIVVADRYVAWITVAGGTRADLEAFGAALDLDGLPGLR